MNFKLRLLALLLTVMIFLSSCSVSIESLMQMIPGFGGDTETTQPTVAETTKKKTTKKTTTKPIDTEPKWDVSDHSMTKNEVLALYTLTQEEVDAALALLDTMVARSMEDGVTVEDIDVIYDEFETAFYHIAQQRTLASIVYYCNMSDETASERHLNTQEMLLDVQDKYTESCRDIYLNSPIGKELFADWSPEEIQELLDFDPTTTQLKKEVEELQVEFNKLSEKEQLGEEGVVYYNQIVTKNNELARLYEYDNYYDYASERVYGREYGAEDLEKYREYIIKYVMPTFGVLDDGWRALYDMSDYSKNIAIEFLTASFDSMDKNYVLLYLESLGDTGMGIGMRDVFDSKNCVFSYNTNSHPTAFQTYLYEDETPFCLFGANGQSSNTLIHEFGHYYASYTNNDIGNYDLCETHSQGNEFLFIKYTQRHLPSKIYEVVRYYNLFNAYYTIVCAAAIDAFEQRVYSLESVEGFTGEDYDAIMDEVLAEFGHDNEWFADGLTDMHEYWRRVAIDNPVYYISYSVSAIAALEVFALAEEDYDAALVAYSKLVDGITEEDGFIGALKKAGFGSPFDEDTYFAIQQVLQ